MNLMPETSMPKAYLMGGELKNAGCIYPQLMAFLMPLLMVWFIMVINYVAVSKLSALSLQERSLLPMHVYNHNFSVKEMKTVK